MLTFNLAALHTQDAQTGAPTPGYTTLTDALVVVFDTFRTGGEPSVNMKIMQASQVLFHVPLQKLIDRGKPIIEKLHSQGIDVSSEAAQLPTSGMAKYPNLAVRYNIPEANKIRRIQMKFTSPQDFDSAYDHVRELGLWFTPAQKARSGPSCPPSQLSEITGRPSTALPSTSADLQAQLKDATGLRPSTASFFRSGSTASSRRPDSAASLSHENTSGLPLSTRLDAANALIASDLPPRRELPFERLDTPESTGTNSRPGSRPLSGVMGPPALPASALNGNKRPKSRSGSSHGTELPPLRKPTYISKTLTGQISRLNTGPGSGLAAKEAMRPHSAITHDSYTAMQQMMSSAPVLIPSDPRPASSYNTATTYPLSTITNHHGQADTSADLVTPLGSDVNMLNSEDNGDSEHHAEELAAYAKQSNEVRLNELNTFIFDRLQDDNFLKLVDDMQMAWVRISTGLE